jgi:hypothetical protein
MRGVRLTLAVLVARPLLLSALGAGAADARAPARAAPVPSLQPAKTQALWKELVEARRASASAVTADCRPLRGIFYAATDWLRLATKLAAASSPCARHYISIPPLVADKTQARPDQAWRIRALGPNFHALAEIHFTTWNRWVAETGNSWHTAGVTARDNMAAAGFDVAAGDSWVVNELNSAVRRGDGNARANVREFVRGLYEGDGTQPTRGAAFVIGFGQQAADVSVYQNTLQHWLADSAFWTDMSKYVADWSQEVYGDVRSHAVAGSPVSTRREHLNDYLQHKLVLASAGPAEVEPARSYLREAHSPLANAAWQYDASFGWTAVPAEGMAAYVSGQVNALRNFSALSGQAQDHWGFAWAPNNPTGVPSGDFAAQTGLVLDRMAAAIRDSGNVEPDPGSSACGAGSVACAVDVAGARHSESWRAFRTWASSAVTFTTPVRTAVAGTPSGPFGLALVTTTGARVTSSTAPRVATVRSSSPSGTFSATAAGPWTPTLTLTIPADGDGVLHYRDTRAGPRTITASVAGSLSGAQAVTVRAGPVATVRVSPASGTVRARGTRRFVATAVDAFGNAAQGSIRWRVEPRRLGKVTRVTGGTATVTAERLVRRGRVVASVGATAGAARFAVRPAALRIRSEASLTRRGARIVFRAHDGARRPVPRAVLVALVRQDGRTLRRARVRTGTLGRAQLRMRNLDGCATVRLARVSAAGFRWNGRTPRSRVCA